jgi:hypothetical protein
VNAAPFSARFAHKPSCPHTRARLLRIGELRLCRGCTMLWVGGATGVWAATTATFGALAGFALLTVGLAGLHAPLYARLPNLVRDAVRFALGAGPLPAAVGSWRAGLWYPAAVALWCAGVVIVVAMRARRARQRHVCEAVSVRVP